MLALAYDAKRRQLHVAGKFNAIDGHNIPSGLAIYDENSRISSLFDLFTGGVDSGNTGGAFYEETTTTFSKQ